MSDFQERGGRAGWNGDAGAPWCDRSGDMSNEHVEHAAPRPKATPSFEPRQLEAYDGTGYELIPLHAPDAADQRGRPIGKAPFRGWRQDPAISAEDAHAHMRGGENIGVRLRDVDLVVDIDPRNFCQGDDPLARLQNDLGFDAGNYPTVITGSGGKHIYMLKPAEMLVSETLPDYLGIEFKTLGRQVVAAGSVHPDTRRSYRWDDDVLAVPLSAVRQAPPRLLDITQRPSATSVSGGGERTPEELAAMLDGLDVTQFRDQGRWLEVMMASHHATAGDGRQEFITWSTGDPQFADDAWIIGRRWDSLNADSAGRRVTERTLFKALVDQGRVDLLPRPNTEDDFPDNLGGDSASEGAAEALATVNAEYFTVLTAGKYLVGKERRDPLSGHLTVEWYPDHAVRKHLDACSVEVGAGKRKPLGGWWVNHPKRRRFDGVLFDPTPSAAHPHMYNLWRGWAVEPREGDWSMMKHLLREVLCGGDESAYLYALRWAAFMVQKPHVPAEVALVFRGAKGVGKGTFARALKTLAGAHGRQVAQPEHFTGKFNEHLSDTILLFVDEGLWAGDKKLEGALKNLITEPTLTFEGKYKPLVTGPNRLHVIIASNESWVVPASPDERRFAVFEANSKSHRNLPPRFFEELNRQMEGGGYEAMLAELQAMDLEEWHPRSEVPVTGALIDQKLQGLRSDPLAFWWYRTLEDGSSGMALDREGWISGPVDVDSLGKEDMLADLDTVSSGMGRRREFTKTAMARFLGSVGVNVGARDKRGGKVWRVPRLEAAREAFERHLGGPLDWD